MSTNNENDDNILNYDTKIMVLDDDIDITRLVKMCLQVHGFKNVSVFTNPLLALEDIRQNSNNYSLVITDIRMPGLNGYDLARHISRTKPEIKVIFLTAFDIDNNELLNMNAKYNSNINCVIQKPVSLKGLAKIVSETLQ